ncbi:MAG: hypothetical protein HUJ90_00915 [Bacteroidales bacterium]|nr:hypothetical protein [Bacteroidales bacterium]
MKFISKIAIAVGLLGISPMIKAETPLTVSTMSEATKVSPYYFGPNAFPVPEMMDGTTSHNLRLELLGENYFGYAGDNTFDLRLNATIPLFTDRVNLTIWMPVMEWYSNTDLRMKQCRIDELAKINPKARSGHLAGDVYVSTEIRILVENSYRPDLVARAAIKSASGNGFDLARYYDSPGYFFDAAVGKSFPLGNHSIRLAASLGFLCWQTDNGRQNDAVMYGALFRWRYKNFQLTETFSGYHGWESLSCKNKELAKDSPMVLKTQLNYRIGNFELHASYQAGLMDYPFHQLQIGLAYNLDVLGRTGL